MKQYVIDELRYQDYEILKKYFDDNYTDKSGSLSGVDGIYWIPLDNDILTNIQLNHIDCQPFFFAVDVELSLISFELLVRTKNRVRCDCMSYADEKQFNWLIKYTDSVFRKLNIII